jgi:hypothetical protein
MSSHWTAPSGAPLACEVTRKAVNFTRTDGVPDGTPTSLDRRDSTSLIEFLHSTTGNDSVMIATEVRRTGITLDL